MAVWVFVLNEGKTGQALSFEGLKGEKAGVL